MHTLRICLAALLSVSATPAFAQTKAPIMKPDAFDIVALGDGVHALIRRDPTDDAANSNVMMPGHGEVQRDMTYLSLVREALGAVSTQMRDAVAKGLTLERARVALDIVAIRQKLTGGDKGLEGGLDYAFVTPATERAYLEAKGEIK